MTDKNRRQFVSVLGAGAVAIPLSAVVGSNASHAADAPMVDVESAQAKALSYIAMSEKPDQNCMACTLYQGAADSANGPCPLFPGSSVSAKAWCSAYTPKA
ncbi:MAG: high-potential iron-sulfur protein [Gammaproteobacteria bacterium]|nr:high-potential iron-sulfur protein [Gammaproteobacteria bacterium]